jgi:hypothetical protein
MWGGGRQKSVHRLAAISLTALTFDKVVLAFM